MATSSLKKTFTISSSKESDAFAKMLSDSAKNPPVQIPEVRINSFSKKELVEIISARTCKTN